MSCEVPVLFIIFNKIEETKKVFAVIREIEPLHLFVAADGPRGDKPDDFQRCSYIRNWILENIDWSCEVKTLFRETNRGCGRGPSEAITWFFEHVGEGVILEDDCLPHPDFFSFCSQLLEKYRHENSISAISGNNFQSIQPMSIESDYYFSVFPSSWGWATWKRAWHGFNFHIDSWRSAPQTEILAHIFEDKKYSLWWKRQFDWMLEVKPEDMWDFQFHYYSMYRRQLAIIPKSNLVSNIGHGEHGTHFLDPTSVLSNLPTYELNFPLVHPQKIKRNYEADIYIQNLLFGQVEVVGPFKKAKRLIKQMVGLS